MSKRPLILLCEDNREDAFLLRRAFAKADLACSILDVRNGQQAINYLSGTGLFTNREEHPLPDLVVLDLKMPLMDGFEVLAWMQTKPELKGIPAIILSGSAESADVEASQKLGAQEYLVKPKDWDELISFARKLHERYLSKPSSRVISSREIVTLKPFPASPPSGLE
jgi:CheY-like chemotaxis protein